MIDMIFPTLSDFEVNLPYFLVGVGCGKRQGYMRRDEDCSYFEWLQTRSGKGELIVDGVRKTVGENQGMLLYLNEPHEYYAVDGTWDADWIIIGGNSVEPLFKSMGIDKSEVFNISNTSLLLSKMEMILNVACGEAPLKNLDCSSLVYDFTINLIKYSFEGDERNLVYHYSRLKPILDYIDDNFDRVLSLDELSSLAGLTPEYFCTVFKKVTGMRVSQYLNNIRIGKSKKYLIRNKNENIANIARRCGYEDAGYFNHIFKKYERITPGEFRRRY
jgi:AraC-like DNA-binding protein